MGKIVSKVTDAVGLTDSKAGKRAEKAATQAAATQAGAQREALEYLKETERLPQQFREEALTELAGFYKAPGAPLSQKQLLAQARRTPLYNQLRAAGREGEQAILRNASVTGGLRSGNVQDALAENAAQIERDALLQSYGELQRRDDYTRAQHLQGLTGLAQLPSLAPQIAQQTAGIGQTLAQGRVAGQQAQLSGEAQHRSNLLGLTQLAIGAFSDSRLKDDIKHVGEKNGHQWFTWSWNKAAEKLGLSGEGEGVMAHLVNEYMPEAIGLESGYITVDYDKLGVC